VEALVNKYRPKKLSEVIGQPVVVQAFTNAFKYKTLHHAYILGGKFGTGKCIGGESLILTNNGCKKISNIVTKEKKVSNLHIKVVDESESGIGSTVNGYFEEGVDVIKITTNEGYSIEGTPEHQIRIIEKSGNIVWKKLFDIKEDDYACIYRNQHTEKNTWEVPLLFETNIDKILEEKYDNVTKIKCQICCKEYGNLSAHLPLHNISSNEYKKEFGVKLITSNAQIKKNIISNIKKDITFPKKIDIGMARLLGYLVAEGHSNASSVSFFNSDLQLVEEVKKIVYKIFNVSCVIKKSRNIYYIRIHNFMARKFLQKIIGEVKSGNKFVPDVILESPKNILKEFLKTYFEGDGTSSKNNIECSSKSLELMHQIQILLLRFGIVSSLKRKYIKKLSYVDKEYVSWRLLIYSNNMKKFAKQIGFVSERKNRRMKKICCHRNNNPNTDIIPYIQEKVYDFWKKLPVSPSGHITIEGVFNVRSPRWPGNCKPSSPSHKSLTYENLKNIIEYFYVFINTVEENKNNIKNKKYYKNIVYSITEIKKFCEDIYKKNYFYTKVTKIEKNIKNVYDICKKDQDKSFIANGFINHNTSVARIIAAMENCEKGIALEPCGDCDNCKAILSGRSYDVREIDAASNRGIEDIRSLHNSIYEAGIQCRTRYVILDECHSLTGFAAEAALKMIEEPPAHVRFILATTDPHKIKDTIQSRCIMWKFKKVNWLELYNHLKLICKKEDIEYEDAALKIISKYSKGSVRNSVQNLQTVMNFIGKGVVTLEEAKKSLFAVEEDKYFELIDAILENRGDKTFIIINDILKDGKEADIILDGLYNHLNNILLVKKCKNDLSEFSLTDDEIKRYELQSSKFVSPLHMVKMMNLMAKVGFGLNVNMNPQALLNQFAYESMLELRLSTKSHK